MVPANNTPQVVSSYHTLEEIRQRKDELAAQLQGDSKQFQTLWNEVFIKREETSKGDFIASMVSKGVTLIDLFLLYRKLRKNYGGIFGGKKSRKR